MTTNNHRADALATVSSPDAPVVRSSPTPCTNYLEYRPTLRWDFWYSCAYCTLAESEATGVGFEMDHYLPQARYPELASDYANLFWSCRHCNDFKRDYPTEGAARRGYRFYRADMDNPAEHFAVSAASPTRLESRSEAVGRYTIEQLNLNRATLRRLRELRARLFQSQDVLVQGLRRLEGIRMDRLSKESKAKFAQARSRLSKDSEAVDEIVNAALLREMNRSEFIDPPPESAHDAAQRKRYLKSVNAALPNRTG